MQSFLIRRVLQAVAVLFGVSLIAFILLHLLPGGPAKAALGLRANKALIAAFDVKFGLLKPLPIQYLDWVNQLIHGNLGFSYKLNQSVDSLLGENIPRTLVLVGVATALALMVAVPAGIYQAVRRNKPEGYVLTGFSFLFHSMPSFFLGTILIIVIASVAWLVPAWLVRAETLSLKTRPFVEATRVQGAGPLRIIFRHIIPNVVGTVVVNSPFQVAAAVLAVTSLSFLGLGIPPPAANWGSMLSNGVNYLYSGYWWQIWSAGLCIVVVIVAFNFIGDGLRDAFEVRLQRR
jgi:ABC-type dipeptide/oligopeptide/nickel transport system permease subunit